MKKILSQLVLVCATMNVFATTQIVTVQNFSFSPVSFTINVGDTVKWTWINSSHTTTSLTIPAGATGWDQAINSVSTTFVYIPAVAGTYSYKCTPHFSIGMMASFDVMCPQVNVQIAAGSSTTFCSGSSVNLISNVGGNPSSYQWLLNNMPISGATNSTYTASATGNYSLSAVNSCGSSAGSNSISVTVNKLPAATVTPAGAVTKCQTDTLVLTANTGMGLTYIWLKNNVVISGATAKVYKAVNAGKYKVRVTKTATGCARTSPVTTITINCRPDESAAENIEMKIYPNPSSGSFDISISNYEGAYISVKDIKGAIVFSEKAGSGELTIGQNFSAGVYFVELSKDDKLIARNKIVKNKE